MQRLALFALAFSSLTACESPSAPTPQVPSIGAPSTALIANTKTSITGALFNPCAPSEWVTFAGSIHWKVTGEVTPTSQDIKIHSNTQGIAGVGLTSGDKYNVHQNYKNTIDVTGPPITGSQEYDIRYRLIRQGSNDNLWLRQTVRVTYNPFSVEVIRNEFECRG